MKFVNHFRLSLLQLTLTSIEDDELAHTHFRNALIFEMSKDYPEAEAINKIDQLISDFTIEK